MTKNSRGAFRRIDEPHQQLERRGLARAVGAEESEYFTATHFEVQVVERSDSLLLEKTDFIVFSELDDFNHCFAGVFACYTHFVVLSRHFPATRKKVSRISGSGIRSACSRRAVTCSSGAVNLTSWGAEES